MADIKLQGFTNMGGNMLFPTRWWNGSDIPEADEVPETTGPSLGRKRPVVVSSAPEGYVPITSRECPGGHGYQLGACPECDR